MTRHYDTVFENSLMKIVSEQPNKVAEEILYGAEKFCDFLGSLEDITKFQSKVKKKCRLSKMKPNIYSDNGFCKCDCLFFEYEFDVREGMAVICFYLPDMFINKDQKEELKVFITNSSADVIFYLALYISQKL